MHERTKNAESLAAVHTHTHTHKCSYKIATAGSLFVVQKINKIDNINQARNAV